MAAELISPNLLIFVATLGRHEPLMNRTKATHILFGMRA